MRTVFVVGKDQMGCGDKALGQKILGSCLRKLVNRSNVEAIVFYNTGVQLLLEGSPVAVEVGLLQEHGLELLPCKTCVEHFGIQDRLLVDRLSDMDEILSTIDAADKVVTL